jgi:hypothetical protein
MAACVGGCPPGRMELCDGLARGGSQRHCFDGGARDNRAAPVVGGAACGCDRSAQGKSTGNTGGDRTGGGDQPAKRVPDRGWPSPAWWITLRAVKLSAQGRNVTGCTIAKCHSGTRLATLSGSGFVAATARQDARPDERTARPGLDRERAPFKGRRLRSWPSSRNATPGCRASRLVGEVGGDAGAGEGDDADRQRLEHPVVALEGGPRCGRGSSRA